jgi:hypothetical protein
MIRKDRPDADIHACLLSPHTVSSAFPLNCSCNTRRTVRGLRQCLDRSHTSWGARRFQRLLENVNEDGSLRSD